MGLNKETMKTFMNLSVRLRQNSGSSQPEYTESEVNDLLQNNSVVFITNTGGTTFLCDKTRTNKIIGVIETKI